MLDQVAFMCRSEPQSACDGSFLNDEGYRELKRTRCLAGPRRTSRAETRTDGNSLSMVIEGALGSKAVVHRDMHAHLTESAFKLM